MYIHTLIYIYKYIRLVSRREAELFTNTILKKSATYFLHTGKISPKSIVQ